MSFDPITLALAKNYTDEKVGNGGGSGGGSGGGLPVVTISSWSNTEYEFVDLTEEEAAQMEAIAAAGTPFILRRVPMYPIAVSALCYEWITMKGTDGMAGQYIAKCDAQGEGYFVIQKSDFTAPWQIAWGQELEQMLM